MAKRGRVSMVFDAETAAFVNKVVRSKDEIGRLEKKLADMQNRVQSAGRGGKRAFDDWTRSAVGLVTKLGGLAMIIAGIRKALRSLEEERKRAAQGTEERAGYLGRLLQLSGGRRSEKERMFAGVKATQLEGGVGADAAEHLQFVLESVGATHMRKRYADATALRMFRDPGAVAESVASMRRAFTPKEAGTHRQLLNKALFAAGKSKVGLSQFGPALLNAAQQLRQIGTSDEEAMAVMSALTMTTKSPEVAAEQIKAIADVGIKRAGKLKPGAGLLDIVGKIRGMDLQPERLRKFLGTSQATTGYLNILLNQERIADLQAGITREGAAGAGEGLLARSLRVGWQDPVLSAAADKRKAEQRAKLNEERRGIERLQWERTERQLAAGMSDRWFGARLASSVFRGAASLVGVSPEATALHHAEMFGLPEGGLTLAGSEFTQDAINKLNAAADNLGRGAAAHRAAQDSANLGAAVDSHVE